jgi:hypothetical protein
VKREPIVEVPLDCHLGCAEFTGGHHVTEINPVATDDPKRVGLWRSECVTCATVLSANHPNRDAAACRAVAHALTSPVTAKTEEV